MHACVDVERAGRAGGEHGIEILGRKTCLEILGAQPLENVGGNFLRRVRGLDRLHGNGRSNEVTEIEVETLSQLNEALACGATMILLDNMDIPTLHEAVRRNAGRAILEISGGVNLQTVRALAETGVDRISIGGLTKDVKAVDFSMRFESL